MLMTTSDATFKLASARDEKMTFSSDKCTISTRQGGLGFWLEFLLLISQEGKVTMSVTVSGRTSVVHHSLSNQLPAIRNRQNGFLGTVLSEAAPTLSNLVPIYPPWSRKLEWITTKGAFQPQIFYAYSDFANL